MPTDRRAKQAARELAAADEISYTAARRRLREAQAGAAVVDYCMAPGGCAWRSGEQAHLRLLDRRIIPSTTGGDLVAWFYACPVCGAGHIARSGQGPRPLVRPWSGPHGRALTEVEAEQHPVSILVTIPDPLPPHGAVLRDVVGIVEAVAAEDAHQGRAAEPGDEWIREYAVEVADRLLPAGQDHAQAVDDAVATAAAVYTTRT